MWEGRRERGKVEGDRGRGYMYYMYISTQEQKSICNENTPLQHSCKLEGALKEPFNSFLLILRSGIQQ